MATERKYPWWLIVLGAAALFVGGIVVASVLAPEPEPPEPVYLPAEAVTVEVVDQATLNELAVLRLDRSKLISLNGELRDENGRLLKVVDSLSVDTGPVASPEPEIITKVVMAACEDDGELQGKATLSAFQFEGIDLEGGLNYGWQGEIGCEVTSDGLEWAVLVREPFTLENTVASTTAAPVAPRRPQRWSVGLHYSLLTESTLDQYSDYYSISSFRVYGARRWFPLKRYSVETGLFVSPDAAGVTLGLSF